GGAHVGGAHVGGAYLGGAHIGGYRGGAYHVGGYRGGVYRSGYHYPRNYAYYGAWPYSSYDGAYPYSPDSDYYGDVSSSDRSSPAYDSGSDGSFGVATSSDSPAQITVSVPADADVWFDGTRMTTTGSVRAYQSPALTPGSQ